MTTKETSLQVPEDQNSDLSKNADSNQDQSTTDEANSNLNESTRDKIEQDDTSENSFADKDKQIGNAATPRPLPPLH